MHIDRRAFLLGAGLTLLGPTEAEARTRPIYYLPKAIHKKFAWTIDDGVSNSAILSYLNIAEKYDQHLTFFVTSCYSGWKKNHKSIQALVDAGKIQLANHTLSHRDLSKSSAGVIRNQLLECHKFIYNEYGYDARPFFRPTYGYWNDKVLKVAAELGYTAPMMWMGTLGDQANLPAKTTISLAEQWIHSGRIIIDHANSVKSADELNAILNIINRRELKSITLREAFNFR